MQKKSTPDLLMEYEKVLIDSQHLNDKLMEVRETIETLSGRPDLDQRERSQLDGAKQIERFLSQELAHQRNVKRALSLALNVRRRHLIKRQTILTGVLRDTQAVLDHAVDSGQATEHAERRHAHSEEQLALVNELLRNLEGI